MNITLVDPDVAVGTNVMKLKLSPQEMSICVK